MSSLNSRPHRRPSHPSGGRVAWAALLGLVVALLACSRSDLPWLPTPAQVNSPTPTPPPSPTATFPPTSTATVTASLTPTWTPVPPPTASVILGPYLQAVSPTSILVVWETDSPMVGEVAFGPAGAGSLLETEAAETTRHAILLSGLGPYSDYHYQIVSRGWPMTPEASFRTAPLPYTSPFSFVVYGDTQSNPDIHAAIIEAILPLAPDLALHTGDLVPHGNDRRFWASFFDIERNLLARTPLYPTLGNHDEGSSLYFGYFFLPGNERWYAFDYGNARFICLEVDGAAEYGPGSEQYAFLESALASSDQTWQIVYFHFPPYSGTSEEPDEVDVRRALTPLFVRYGVDLVFNGHHHNYQHYLVDGVTYIVTGGAGGDLLPIVHSDDETVSRGEDHHFVYVTISGATLSATSVTPWGEVLDQFSLTPR